jgi:hypothetical protein
MFTNNCVHTMFRIWYMTLLLSSLLFSGTHVMQGFLCEILLRRNYNITLLLAEVSYRRKYSKVNPAIEQP